MRNHFLWALALLGLPALSLAAGIRLPTRQRTPTAHPALTSTRVRAPLLAARVRTAVHDQPLRVTRHASLCGLCSD